MPTMIQHNLMVFTFHLFFHAFGQALWPSKACWPHERREKSWTISAGSISFQGNDKERKSVDCWDHVDHDRSIFDWVSANWFLLYISLTRKRKRETEIMGMPAASAGSFQRTDLSITGIMISSFLFHFLEGNAFTNILFLLNERSSGLTKGLKPNQESGPKDKESLS